MIITDFSAICNLGDNICEIFQNATNGKLRNFSINSPLPEIKSVPLLSNDQLILSLFLPHSPFAINFDESIDISSF